MGGAMSRRKGATYERDVACLLRDIFPGAKRGVSQSQDPNSVPDVDGTPFWIECKKQRRTNPRAALEQARAATAAHSVLDQSVPGYFAPVRPPVAICCDDQDAPGVPTRPFVVMQLHDWLDLVRAAHMAHEHHALAATEPSAVNPQAVARLHEAMDALHDALVALGVPLK